MGNGNFKSSLTVRSVAWESQVTAHILPLHSDTNSFPRLSGEVSHRFKVEMTRFQAFKCVALSSPEGPKEGSSKFIHVWPRKKKKGNWGKKRQVEGGGWCLHQGGNSWAGLQMGILSCSLCSCMRKRGIGGRSWKDVLSSMGPEQGQR